MNDIASGESEDWGEPLFEARFSRLFASMFILVGLVFFLIMGDALFFHIVLPIKKGIGLKLIFGFFWLLSGLILYTGAMMMKNPKRMLVATAKGIVTYVDGANINSEGFFIPWERVESMALKTVYTRSSQGRSKSKIIELVLHTDADWDPGSYFASYNSEKRSLPIDAFSCSPRGQKLYDALNEIRKTAD